MLLADLCLRLVWKISYDGGTVADAEAFALSVLDCLIEGLGSVVVGGIVFYPSG